MRIVFMGTPKSAVPSLARCVDDNHEVVAVWTQPDKSSGRGKRVSFSPVKEFAVSRGLPVHQPSKIRIDEAKTLFASHKADAAVVVAYGRILPAEFLRAPRLGCINVHFSLLPSYRGAAPVNWAIVCGEERTGVTTMFIEEQLDSGPILLQRETKIGRDETATQLVNRLAPMGAELLSETLARLSSITPRRQPDYPAPLAPLLKKEDGRIDWSMDAFSIERRVRGFQPWPHAYTFYDSRRLIIWSSLLKTPESNEASPGTVITAHGDELTIMCGEDTALRLLEVQPEGGRRMTAREFINGARVRVGRQLK
jgi:methionyl-tRNA formyltransferase